MHYFRRPGLKEFLEFCLVNFEVIFWTTAESRTLVPQYEKLLEDDKFASYKQVFPEFAAGFEIAAPATPWSIPLPGMNKFYTPMAPPLHAPSLGS